MSAQLRKYGTSCTIYFPLIKASSNNFAVSGDYTHASGDVKISKDGGAAATATNAPSAIAMGNGAMWSLTLTAAEMQAAEVIVTVIDATSKAVEDQMIVIHTFGHASAMIVADLSAANLAANVTQFGGSNLTASGGRPEVNLSHVAGSAVSTSTAQLGVNVVNFGGAAGTFASGRPEVNTSHISGSAVSTTSAQIGVNVVNAGGTAWGSGAITAASIAASALDNKGNWNVGKTGYALTQSFPTNFASLAITVGGAVTAGTVSDKTGYSLSQAFPSNFASLGINASGHVSRVTLVDTTTTNADMRGTDNAMLASSYTSPPSAASNASAVRSELAVELARIDATTSSRLAASSYVSPPSASTIATQVDITLSGSHGSGDWGPGTSGTGAYTLTITVDDGLAPLEGAKIRLTHGATALTETTDVNGVAEFGCDALTYSVAITKQGYSFTPTTKVVSESGPEAYSMTASGPTPSADPDATAVRITCRDGAGAVEPSAVVQLRLAGAPDADEGNSYSGAWVEYTADENGIIDVTCVSGAEYWVRRTGGASQKFTPTGATYPITSFVGPTS